LNASIAASTAERIRNEPRSTVLYRLILLTLGIITCLLLVLLKSSTILERQGSFLFFAYTIFVTSFELSRILGAMLHQRVLAGIVPEAFDDSLYEPSVTFVVPCMNEQDAIRKTVTTCFEADYPDDKLEVIVINDGSTDNTLSVLRELESTYERLTVVNWDVNRGKRHGMAEGFRRATGEVIIQLDSDSYIEPYSLRELVRPFQNSAIGAVCAHADPANANHNFLTRMQAAYYFMSFRILKSAESTFLTVFCCSGCSSAYRKEVVLPILDVWLNERFLGRPVTWGDDRALTNWVLRRGFRTIYTDRAQAYTICPQSLRQLLKQQIRWKKGWFVNSVFFVPFVLRRHPFVAFTYFIPLIFLTLATPFMAAKALVYQPLVEGVTPVYYVLGVFMIALLMTLYYRHVRRGNAYWTYMFVWSAINMVVLSFILFYALFTIQNRKWGTR
jgi:hyaluronan synthase